MNRVKLYLVLAFTFLGNLCALSQKIFFEQLTTAEGLPSDYVNCVFRDGEGYLWIGTDKGVCRYDGQNFLYFNKDNGLPSNFVYCVAEDHEKNIWFGTFEGGLCKYDGQVITPLQLDPVEFKNIFKIVVAPDGSLFIISGLNHLYRLKNGSLTPEKIKCDYCLDFSCIQSNRFILENYNGLFSLTEDSNGFSIRTVWTRRTNTNVFSHLRNNRAMVQEGDSLVIYSVIRNSALVQKKYLLPSSARTTRFWAYITNENELWIVMSNGVVYKNQEGESNFFNVESGLGGINYVKDINEDNEKNLYISTYGGGVKIKPRLYLREYSIEGKVNSIYMGEHGTYVTTTSGFYKYDSRGKVEKLNTLSFQNFTSTFRSPDGHFYMGTNSGFLQLPNESVLYTLTKSSEKRYETYLSSGASGFLWEPANKVLVSSYGEGVLEYDVHSDAVRPPKPTRRQIGSNLVEFLVPLKNSFAALSTNDGITLTSTTDQANTISKKNGLLSNSVYSVFQENQSEIWIGTLHGLNLYDGNKIKRTFSYKQGFVGSKVVCIFRDSQHRFWVLSDKFLHLFDGARLRPIRSHPLLYSTNSINRAQYDTATGTLYLGLTDAFVVVDVRKITPDTVVRFPRLISIMGKSASFAFDKLDVQNKDKIVFRLASQPYLKAEQSDIYYKLKGYSDEWKLLDYTMDIAYQKLPPGRYELIAKSVNPDYYSSPNVALARFQVLPPFWMRSWFILTSLAIFFLTVFLASSRYSRRKYERKIKQMQEQQKLQVERERIARELHDNVGSQLTYLINKIEDAPQYPATKEDQGHLSVFARGAMRELRETIWALDKKEILPEELGNKVRQLVRLYENHRFKITTEWGHNNDATPFNSLQALNIYRIIQEALNNAVKYSEGSDIRITATFAQSKSYISIADNGKGFDLGQVENGYGLLNMKKRAEEMNAQLEVTSKIKRGTNIRIIWNGNS